MKFLHDVIYKGSLTVDGAVTLKSNTQIGDSRLDVHNVYGALVVGNGSTGTDITALTVKAMGTGASLSFRVRTVNDDGDIFAVQENKYVLIGADYVTTTNGQQTINFLPSGPTPGTVRIYTQTNNTGGTYRGLWIQDWGFNGYSGGTSDTRYLDIDPTFNNLEGFDVTVRGVYYHPTVTSLTGTVLKHIAWENTVGDIIHGNLAGTGTRMVVADSNGKLSVQTIPSFTESDTLDSVTGRGAVTTNNITTGGITANGVVSITTSTGGAIEFYPEGGGNATYSWMRAKLGSGLAPTLAWYGDVAGSYKAYGIYGPDSTYDGLLIYREAPTLADVILMGASKIALPSTQVFVWSSTTNVVHTPDLGLAREAAGLIQINNGSLNTYASLKLLNLTATGLAGSGTRMVTVDANGLLGSQAIPTGGTGGSGTVTSVSVVTANGFAGTVATDTTTPAITLSTTVTGLLKGNGTAISAASAGTDYEVPLTFAQGLTRTSNTIKWGGSVSEDITLTEGTNTYVLSGLGFKRVRWNVGTVGGIYGSVNTTYNAGSPLAELDVQNVADNTSANVYAYINGTNPMVGILAKGKAPSNYQVSADFNSSGITFSTHPTGIYTPRFTIDLSGNLYINTTPSSTTTETQFLVRASSGGQLLYRTFDPSNYLTTASAASTYQPLDADLTAIAALSGTSGLLKKTAADTWTLDTNTYLTANQTITLSGAVTGSGTTAITTTLANSVVGISNLSATGTASASTYLRGDNTWATISATDTNIYNTDGTLTGNRTLSGNLLYNLYFNDLVGFRATTGRSSLESIDTQIVMQSANSVSFTAPRANLLAAIDPYPYSRLFAYQTETQKQYLEVRSNAIMMGGVVGSNLTNLFVYDLPTVTTLNVLYYNTSNGQITYGAAPSGGGYTVTSQTSNYTETATSGTKIIKGDTTGGLFTVTLPTAVGNTATIIVKKTAGTPALKVAGASGSETIDGSLQIELFKVNESVTLISDNANWQIV